MNNLSDFGFDENQTLEDLKRLGNGELPVEEAPLEEPENQEPVEGEGEVETEEEPSDKPQKLYMREIDLGDGSGVQVFKATTMKGLIDELAKAQLNATKKIRELNAQIKQTPAKNQNQNVSEQDEFIIGQEMLSKPSEAFKKLFEKMVGMPLDSFSSRIERLTAFEQAQAWQMATEQFIQRNPDYVANTANGTKLVNYLKKFGHEHTLENLETAFADLKNSGLLELKSKAQGEESSESTEDAPTTQRIAGTGKTTQVVTPTPKPKKAASGLSARANSISQRAKVTEPTEEELFSMPEEQLRELANRQLRERHSS